MDTTVRATCPKCRSVLKIPAQWVGLMVRCKKCNSVMRSKLRTTPSLHPAGNAIGFAQPAAIPVPLSAEPFPLPEPIPQQHPQPVVVAAYPYPVPTGYPPPGAYAPPPGYPYAMPPGYPQPTPYASAPPQPEQHEFAPEQHAASVTTRRYLGNRSNRGSGKLVGVTVFLLLAGGVVSGAYFGLKYADTWFGQQDQAANPPEYNSDGNGQAAPDLGAQPVVQLRGPFPRRMLFISATRYMFLNPLTGSSPGGADSTKPAAMRLAYEWQMPTGKDNNQVFVLSDTAPLAERQTPFKNVVVGAYEQFFTTSREQDRIVVYFGGHAIEKDGKVYLASVEGELDDVNSLIPLAEFYDKLDACKAIQKVVIWDVCRFNPARGNQRPGSEPMTESLAAALTAAPAGVEVVLTCQPGENSLEFDYPPDLGGPKGSTKYSGSAFLDSMRYAADKSRAGKQPTQIDPIPVAEWVPTVARRASEMAASGHAGARQTVKADGKPKETPLVFNPDQTPAKRFDMPSAPKGVSAAEITAIEKEFSVPPIKLDLKDGTLGELPFLAEVMNKYKPDVPLDTVLKDEEMYRFRVVTWNALEKVRKMWSSVPGTAGGPLLRDDFFSPVNDALKRDIKAEQKFWADGIAELELQNSFLDEIAGMLASQPPRWQAHYEYARAVVKTRLAYMIEYNKVLGDVLTESLPVLDPKLDQNAYKLVSSDRMKSKGESVKLVKEGQEAYAKLINDHKGTPWAIQAKRDKSFALGLAWQPVHKDK